VDGGFQLERLELLDGMRDGLAGRDEIVDKSFVRVDIAFALAAIAELVAPGQNAPDLRAETDSVWENLEDDVSIS
jgi:hypothetical protein